jgi:hypothetical protein
MERAGHHGDRVVSPPADNDPSVANRILSVLLRSGERVRWDWTVLPDGRRYVSGYRILPAWRSARRSSRRTV